MKRSLLIWFLSVATAALVAGAVVQARSNSDRRRDSEMRSRSAEARIADLRRRVASATESAAVAEAALAAAIRAEAVADASRGSTESLPEIDVDEFADAGCANARRLFKEGRRDDALDVLGTIYRELRRKYRGGVASQKVLDLLQSFGRGYDPAKQLIAKFRDETLAEFTANPTQTLGLELIRLNRALNEEARSLEVLARLPTDVRRSLAGTSYELLVRARLYDDALHAKSYGTMIGLLENSSMLLRQQPAELHTRLREEIVRQTIMGIEVLSGSGRQDEARQLEEKLLTFDGSDETKALIQQHRARAAGK